jgi:hypothetical protein
MMIVIIRRVRTYWYGSNILFNSRLKPSCISLGEELLLVKTKLLLLNSVNVVGVQLGKSIIHGNFLSRSVLVNLVTHEHHVHIFLRNFPVRKVERVLCSLNRSPLLWESCSGNKKIAHVMDLRIRWMKVMSVDIFKDSLCMTLVFDSASLNTRLNWTIKSGY